VNSKLYHSPPEELQIPCQCYNISFLFLGIPPFDIYFLLVDILLVTNCPVLPHGTNLHSCNVKTTIDTRQYYSAKTYEWVALFIAELKLGKLVRAHNMQQHHLHGSGFNCFIILCNPNNYIDLSMSKPYNNTTC
jgi:hypothetical protein